MNQSMQWNTAVQEDAAPATRIPSIRSGTIVEGHYAWKPYEEKTQDLIRKECSLRQIKLNTKTKKMDRITCLRRYDELMNSERKLQHCRWSKWSNTSRSSQRLVIVDH
ncbi:hypothetical protein PPTG_16910 [Phytophthora nicotianae INRA-310]|uniref:Uncharacterized protein n=1 Tax=Phytophthora nicotianae (strain INRA-310) TaxID=761204 RepID=W2PLF6_PHYN3|nr:hypothetical protein PPTG_16910 [Phytophthora nicotianae INRA-310]ETN01823.1 hypothetical protein PPTG_16910 [Phytophthora nicotianae INRA-310]